MSARPKKQLEWSRRSAQDLLNIEEYIAQDNQSAADAVIAHIQQRALCLKPIRCSASKGSHRRIGNWCWRDFHSRSFTDCADAAFSFRGFFISDGSFPKEM